MFPNNITAFLCTLPVEEHGFLSFHFQREKAYCNLSFAERFEGQKGEISLKKKRTYFSCFSLHAKFCPEEDRGKSGGQGRSN